MNKIAIMVACGVFAVPSFSQAQDCRRGECRSVPYATIEQAQPKEEEGFAAWLRNDVAPAIGVAILAGLAAYSISGGGGGASGEGQSALGREVEKQAATDRQRAEREANAYQRQQQKQLDEQYKRLQNPNEYGW